MIQFESLLTEMTKAMFPDTIEGAKIVHTVESDDIERLYNQMREFVLEAVNKYESLTDAITDASVLDRMPDAHKKIIMFLIFQRLSSDLARAMQEPCAACLAAAAKGEAPSHHHHETSGNLPPNLVKFLSAMGIDPSGVEIMPLSDLLDSHPGAGFAMHPEDGFDHHN